MRQIDNILATGSLRRTQTRKDILDIFLQQEVALSEPELEKAMHGRCDRVTIYRTLSTFVEKGILHKVLDDTGAMKYALCAPDCHESHDHRHDHVHFKCDICGKTSCVDEVPIPAVQLPEGYRLSGVNMLLQGTCPECEGMKREERGEKRDF
jgi:Fur family ferric uptake transcriptional regulator